MEEIMSLPEIKNNPLFHRVASIMDTDKSGQVDFEEFLNGLSQFSVRGSPTDKLKFAFSIYDIDKDGYISNGELFQVLRLMVGKGLEDAKLQQIVDKTILMADTDMDGKLSFEEFCKIAESAEIHKELVVGKV